MARHDKCIEVLPYAPPRPKAPRPAFLFEVGCISSFIGAILFGVVMPWFVLRDGFVYEGAESFLVWPLAVLFTMTTGGSVGAVGVPAIVLGGYWIIWRLAGRP